MDVIKQTPSHFEGCQRATDQVEKFLEQTDPGSDVACKKCDAATTQRHEISLFYETGFKSKPSETVLTRKVEHKNAKRLSKLRSAMKGLKNKSHNKNQLTAN